MLAKLEMRLDKRRELSSQMASSFHGALMELLPEDYAAALHQARRHAYAQHIERRGEDWYWIVAALNGDTTQKMLKETLMNLSSFTLKKHQLTLQVLEKNYQELTDLELSHAFYQETAERYITVQFMTPTSFKKNGRYINYPDIRTIFSNLMNRYDAANAEESMQDEDTLDQLAEKAVLSRYELRSTVFSLEGVRIPAFLGKMTLRMDGTQTMTNFANMLFRFGTYSGIGIKTALGMGAIRLIGVMDRIRRAFVFAGIKVKEEYWQSYDAMNQVIISQMALGGLGTQTTFRE